MLPVWQTRRSSLRIVQVRRIEPSLCSPSPWNTRLGILDKHGGYGAVSSIPPVLMYTHCHTLYPDAIYKKIRNAGEVRSGLTTLAVLKLVQPFSGHGCPARSGVPPRPERTVFFDEEPSATHVGCILELEIFPGRAVRESDKHSFQIFAVCCCRLGHKRHSLKMPWPRRIQWPP